MNSQKVENKSGDHDDGDHIQPINLVAARTPVPASTFSNTSSGITSQPLALRPHIEPQKTGLMTLYFRTPGPRPPTQVMGPVVGSQSSTGQHFTSKQAPDFKNSNISSWTVIRMPSSDMSSAGTTTANTSGTMTPGVLPSALSGSAGRHMIPAAVHPVIAGNTGSSMASIIRGSHQVPPAGHVIHQSFSSHVPRGPAAVASISAAPKSAVATPILRTPHSATMSIGSSSMMALHAPVRAKSPTLAGRTITPPVVGTSLPQVVDLQKSTSGHSLPASTVHTGPSSRTLDSSVVRTGSSHSSSITIAKPINISQPIVQHLQQMYDKGSAKTVSTSASSNSSSAHQTVLPGTFTSVSEAVSAISRTTVPTAFSTNIMQLSSTAISQPLQALRASHMNQTLHALTSVTTAGSSHQTLTVISAKSLMPANHSISLGTPSVRSATPNTSGNVSGSSSIISSPSRPLNSTNIIGTTAIPVAKVYPQSSRTTNELTSEVTRPTSYHPPTVVTSSSRINTSITTAASGPQSVVVIDKQSDNATGMRFTSLTKAQADAPSYSSSTTYLYHDQYPANLTMHPYSGNSTSSGFTTTQLRPVSFAQHTSSNTSHSSSLTISNPSHGINSVMVAVDSRHPMSLHSPFSSAAKISETVSTSVTSNNSSVPISVSSGYNSTQGNLNNHLSPRPSILRKRTSEGLTPVPRKNLAGTLSCSESISPRPDSASNVAFTSVLTSKPSGDKPKEITPVTVSTSNSLNSTLTLISPTQIKKEPGLTENSIPNPDSVAKDSRSIIEASPRKKPRKQLLSTNELIETHLSEGDENNFDVKMKVKEEIDEDKAKNVTYYKRPSMSLLNTYRQNWKPRHNHFIRYSDVKPREEKKPTVNELANQKGILQQVNGWKVYHLSAQMEDIIEIEETVYSRLSDLLEFVENDPPAIKNRNLFNSEENRIVTKLADLIKGNLQRSKIVQEQITESKQQAIKILDHKPNMVEMVNKYVSRRPLKKKEKT